MTSFQCILDRFANLRCDKTHDHATCEGIDTELTGRYTVEFARAIHRAWRQEAKTTPLPVAPSTAREQLGQPIVVKQHGQPFAVEKPVQHVVSMPVVLRGILDRDVNSLHGSMSTFDMNDLCCIHCCCIGRCCICPRSCINFGPYAHCAGPAGAS